ncbi:hypothetical protein JCM19274_2472 [Algibacter lectus]|uniref:DUF4249 domain-containing protein n=1 Tax=Algibacter lectus TaxID=221126 RepID=A0A090WWP0_9FLAO|nr:DUF4249 domain-containing protein [Algibacter lectus]GAL81396.1 hypothetical protein JCM19274_2472 [Algibacter lectus]
MNKIIYILLISLSFTACEDVIDLELNSAEPRLVIDASLKWIKGTDGKNQFIRLTLSAPLLRSRSTACKWCRCNGYRYKQ